MAEMVLGGAKLYFKRAGHGSPALVLIHGGLCTHEDWASQVSVLHREFTIISADLRGHGRSASRPGTFTIERCATDLRALVDQIGLRHVVLVGHSIGVRIALEVVAQDARAVAGMVLVDGSRMFDAGRSTPVSISGLSDDELLARVGRVVEGAIGPATPERTAQRIRATMHSSDIELKRALFRSWLAWDLHRYDTAVASVPNELPVLAIQSTQADDALGRRVLAPGTTTTPYLDYLRRQMPWMEAAILPGIGHFSMLEAPAAVTRLIRSFAAARRAGLFGQSRDVNEVPGS